MALIYNNISYAFDATKPLELMDIYMFIETFQYPIDKLYIDKFWNAISNDAWVVVDYDMLKRIGYANALDRDKKKKYLKLLSSRFENPRDYEVVFEEELHNRALKGPVLNHGSERRDLKVPDKTGPGPIGGTIIVQARVFKKSLMMLRTKPADNLRDYYIALEELLLDYMRYTQVIKDHNAKLALELSKAEAATKIKALEQQVAEMQLTFDVDTKPVARNEYVYILTNKRNYARHMFKIGKSNNPKSRLISYNTSSPIKDEDMFYIAEIATCDCTSLEKLIHKLLDNYHYRKEWFHIPHRDLKAIVDMVSGDMKRWSDTIDGFIQRGFDNIESIPLDQLHTTDTLNKEQSTILDQISLSENNLSYASNRLMFKKDALTKLSDINAKIPRMTAAKLLQMNEAFTSIKVNICKSCKKQYKTGCCKKYGPNNRTTCIYICNIKLI